MQGHGGAGDAVCRVACRWGELVGRARDPPFTRPEVAEVAAQLDAGVQMVGFAPAGSGLRVRSRVKLQVDESAVVLALWD